MQSQQQLPTQGYGGLTAKKVPGKPEERLPATTVLASLVIPTLIFVVVAYAQGTHFASTSPALATVLFVLCLVMTVLVNMAWVIHYGKTKTIRGMFWKLFLGGTTLIAFFMSTTFAAVNFKGNVVPFENLQKLSVRHGIDPVLTSGTEVMDAGQFTFTRESFVNTTLGIGFRNGDVYCVAPITVGSAPSPYSFWAVGLNCCNAGASTFQCGDVSKASAHGGIRLMLEEQRAFYKLAVEEAEAQYNLKSAVLPVFLYWVEDPEAEMESYLDNASNMFLLAILSHFAGQLAAVFLALFFYTKPKAFSLL